MKRLHFLISKSKRFFRRPILVLLQTSFAILTIGLTACNASLSTDNSSPANDNVSSVIDNLHPYFPTQKNVNGRMQVRSEGVLKINNGYFRLNGYLLIWPEGFSFDTNNTEIRVLDRDEIEVARVGNIIVLGGGVVDKGITEGFMGEKLPNGAVGPYWIVGQIVSSMPP